MRSLSIGIEEERVGLQGDMACPNSCTQNLRPLDMQRAATIETNGGAKVSVTEEYHCPKCGHTQQLSHASRVIL